VDTNDDTFDASNIVVDRKQLPSSPLPGAMACPASKPSWIIALAFKRNFESEGPPMSGPFCTGPLISPLKWFILY